VSIDEKKEKIVTFSGIADPKCKCTPVWLCHRCAGRSKSDKQISERHFAGKFKEPFAEAVKKNNEKGGPN
jgi:hypothetical protein